jgi:hypothetical protein
LSFIGVIISKSASKKQGRGRQSKSRKIEKRRMPLDPAGANLDGSGSERKGMGR